MQLIKSLFRRKSISDMLAEAKNKALEKRLGATDLILMGVGCTIGTGIFVLTGIGAAKYAGPGITLSYILAAVACIFAGFAYAELASSVPVTGSAYTYSYTVFGELIAWIVGWGLILEYAVGASTVAIGWSGYMVGLLNSAGIMIPEQFTKGISDGGIINVPAICISLFIGFLLIRGTKESIVANRILVGVKLLVIFIFLVVATPMIKTENWAEFLPFGWNGVILGAATIFFAYVGFDAVATTAEECKNPSRDLPIGIIGSLIITAILYGLVALVLTGIVHYSTLNNPEPLAHALRDNGSNIGSALVATGAIAGMTSVLLILMYGQSRIFFVMSRDGLISKHFSKIHQKAKTPYVSCLLTTFLVMVMSSSLPLQILSHLTSMGTLLAFIVVAIGVMVLRFTQPNLERRFKCPAVFVMAPLAILSCGYLMFTLFKESGMPFFAWIILGIILYFSYGYRKSSLANQ